MNKVIALILVVIGLSLGFSKAQATTEIELDDCNVYARTPFRSGSVVIGGGEMSCATNHSVLRVVVGLRIINGEYKTAEKYCYNTSICSQSVSNTYTPLKIWQSDISGYNYPFNSYAQSDLVEIY